MSYNLLHVYKWYTNLLSLQLKHEHVRLRTCALTMGGSMERDSMLECFMFTIGHFRQLESFSLDLNFSIIFK